MCSLLSGSDQFSLAICSFKWAPNPSFDASVKICRACFRVCNGWPVITLLSSSHHTRCGWSDFGMGMVFSIVSGTLQLFLRCHCMGLMCKLPKCTCFSVAVSNPIKDISVRTRHTGLDMISRIFVCKACQRSGVGLTLPSFKSNW